MAADDDCVSGRLEPFMMVSHAAFGGALALLGIDVESVFGVSIGPWADADTELWPLAPRMREEGAFWRVRATVGCADPGMSDLKVRYIGIRPPSYEREK
jgi:hypothetical protein